MSGTNDGVARVRPIAELTPWPSAGLRCPETVEKTVQCRIEEVEGVKVRRCTEVYRRIRRCAGRPPEEVEVTRKETEDTCSINDRFPEQHPYQHGSAPRVISPEFGSMLGDFWNFAAELEQNLRREGTVLNPPSTTQSSPPLHSAAEQQGGIFSRLFGRSNERSEKTGAYGSLNKHLKEFSSNVQEI